MSRIVLAPEIAEDFDRILDHLLAKEAEDPRARIRAIVRGIDVLADNPLIGRPTSGVSRELIIGRGNQGYIALYSYDEILDIVFVTAIRSQREAGYRSDS
ncbi:type II toxin-antitoxin system RelE/ParE family toxin [Algiphilus aromaticivorans]|jgi:plasmid stabilization system protein ParE|uniref:type II toxin-antitoxin system RelE/ParE family toxin n=1 Tax=Algiphilus aromaticivorans TaxID=382454 RepID=UPI0005C1D339|nr:type II toxin-antitoxin system RelE/ParE family toxin [Algiphilus aromaticivorans]